MLTARTVALSAVKEDSHGRQTRPRRQRTGQKGRLAQGRVRQPRRDALQVIDNMHVVPAVEHAADTIHDRAADFYSQPATRFQSGVCLRNKALDYFQTGGASENRVSRLKFSYFELYVVGFGLSNIRRIRHDEVKFRIPESGKQVGLVEVNSRFELMTRRIRLCNFQNCSRNIRCMNFGSG